MVKNRRATIKDVARAAGVALATVSSVLNNTAPVSEETRGRVLAAAAELGYRRNLVAATACAATPRTRSA
jgi:LacI family transcriptional regulator